MAHDTELAIVVTELKAVGIKPTQRTTGSGHVEIAWQVDGKLPRRVIVPASGSDWRGRLNARATVRRMLEADNVTLKEVVERRPKSALAKAVSTPGADSNYQSLFDQVAALRCEISELTMMMTEHFAPKQESAFVAALPEAEAAPIQPSGKKQRAKSNMTDITPYLSFGWTTFEDLMKAAGLTRAQASMKLRYLIVTKNTVERSGDKYRLVAKTNGHKNGNGAHHSELGLWAEPQARVS